MQLKSLKIFCDVVNCRSFSKAADENGISQSGASQVVHQLEERLGVKLIDRSTRPFRLTNEGDLYYDGVRKLVHQYLSLEEEVRTLHDEVAGRVRVAAIYSVGLHHMNSYLQQFMTRYPKANVRLEYMHPHRIVQAIENDQADVGLISYPKAQRSLRVRLWREEPMVLVCAPDHRLAAFTRVELEELEGLTMVGFDQDLTIRREIDRVLDARGVEVRVAMEFDNIETIKQAIEIGAGVSLLPEPTVAREVEAGTLVAVPLATEELVRPLGIVYRRGKDLGLTARRFIDLLRKHSISDELESDSGDSEKIAVAADEPDAGAGGRQFAESFATESST